MSRKAVHKLRSPALKLVLVALIVVVLTIALALVERLVNDRESHAAMAQTEINAGWGGPQVLSGPVIVVPIRASEPRNPGEPGNAPTPATAVDRRAIISPDLHRLTSSIDPRRLNKAIYHSTLYDARIAGRAEFALPDDLEHYGITRDALVWSRAELRLGISDPRGLTSGGSVTVGGKPVLVQPGKGPAASGGQGFFAFLDWDGSGRLTVEYAYGLRGSKSLSVVPRGGSTRWDITSSWPDPGFSGGFLPDTRKLTSTGFHASYRVDKLALGQPPISVTDDAAPSADHAADRMSLPAASDAADAIDADSQVLTVNLTQPVTPYGKVSRSLKYGFLFIGLTFVVLLQFDIVIGASVASAEYLLTGAALVLFFVLLLALSELVGFTGAYVLASGAIIGLLSAYSAAVLKDWCRGGLIGMLLLALYALLYVLLNLDAWSLLTGAVLLFVALALVVYSTRNVDWRQFRITIPVRFRM